jgi:hypothetical protein
MDLTQRKLSKSEWESVEQPVSSSEKEVLNLICKGYHDTTIKYNKYTSLFTFLKIEYSVKMEDYLFNKYFSERISAFAKKYKVGELLDVKVSSKIDLKKADLIRLEQNKVVNLTSDQAYEIILINHLEQLFINKILKSDKWTHHYYTLFRLIKNNISYLNKYIVQIVNNVLTAYENDLSIPLVITNSDKYIEKNSDLLKYADMTLYEHQKEIFTAVKVKKPKLILYIAPTGTGKTLTPIGLSEQYKVIFVCAARHVGLALARSAISIEKKIAFAFGCSGSEDVRLHYYAAAEVIRDWRSGSIRKVDNTVGHKVEIIICDIKSYLPAMYYMLSFNSAQNIVTYWDEPTITMDYNNHDFHSIIKKNWKENLIPNFVLSSATLPKLEELDETIHDFNRKFPNPIINNIVSHDCRKTIPLINNFGYIIMPHLISSNYDEVKQIAKHCRNNLTLLRYFDLKEASKFILYCENNNLIKSTAKITRNFTSIDDINMSSIKTHYLKVLENITDGKWDIIYLAMKNQQEKRIKPNEGIDAKGNIIIKSRSVDTTINRTNSIITNTNTNNELNGQTIFRQASQQVIPTNNSTTNTNTVGNCAIYVTTKDAYTLTDGPTIFLANNVEKIAQFCIQQANIPVKIMEDIMTKIEHNNNINEKIDELQKELDCQLDKAGKSDKTKDNKSKGKGKTSSKADNEEAETNGSIIRLRQKIEQLKSMIQPASLNDIFIPNKLAHLNKWAPNATIDELQHAFTSNIDEDTVSAIMLLKNVTSSWKVLLLLGIGVFTNHESIEYTEIMKGLADKQLLYMIIADSDYIYGTNYQFCHGYLSKDMILTQEKIIQALGRIGRNNIQQDYSIRFRDDEQINILFKTYTAFEKPEVINMNKLFTSRNLEFINGEFIEISEKEHVNVWSTA